MDSKRLEEITEKFCNNYCKYADTVGDQDELDDICEKCPMNELFELLDYGDKNGKNQNFLLIVADGLKKHCEQWGYDWIEKLKSDCTIKNFRKLFFHVTHLYYIDFGDELYNVTFDKDKDVAYIKKCGADFDIRGLDAEIDIAELIKLLVV